MYREVHNGYSITYFPMEQAYKAFNEKYLPVSKFYSSLEGIRLFLDTLEKGKVKK